MSLTTEAAVKELQAAPSVFLACSRYTNLPYVTEGEETANDQVWIFAKEQDIKNFGQKLAADKVLIMGMKYEKKDFNRLYATLYAIDVNAVVWNNGKESAEVELSSIARQADFDSLEPSKRPLFNPALQLCGIYFMQELRKPVPQDQKENLHDLEEELLVNLKKAQFLVPMEVSPQDPKKISVPFLKTKNGDLLQPAFSDVMELEKFTRGKKLRAAKVSFEKLPGLLLEQSKAIAINPLGFNLVLDREQLRRIAGIA